MEKVNKSDVFGTSGSGTRFGAHISGSHELIINKGYLPFIMTGISGGSLSNWCTMSRNEDVILEALYIAERLDMHTIFGDKKNHLLKAEGGITRQAYLKLAGGVWKAVRKKPDSVSLGKQAGLEELITKLVPESLFNDYKRNVANGYCSEFYAGLVNWRTGMPKAFPIHKLDYYTACKAVLGSASIVLVSPEVIIGGEPYQDGGHYYHNMLHVMLDSHVDRHQFKRAVSFFARTDDVYLEDSDNYGTLPQKVERAFSIFQNASAEKDEKLERNAAEKLGIQDNHHQVFFDTGMNGFFDVRPQMLKKAVIVGRREVQKLNL